MFDVDVAKEVGIIAAILFQNIAFWCQHSRANNKNFFDGRYWTFNTNKAMCELFPYLSSKMIRTALQKLVDEGLIITGNYNKLAYDRTTWYALTEKGESIFLNGKKELPVGANGIDRSGEPIPDINTDINANINTDVGKKRKRFIPPTVEEIKAYAYEIDYNLDAQYFYDYYQTNNWRKSDGKPVLNWKLTVQTWKRNDQQRGIDTHARRTEPTPIVLTDEERAEIDRIYAQNGRDAFM